MSNLYNQEIMCWRVYANLKNKLQSPSQYFYSAKHWIVHVHLLHSHWVLHTCVTFCPLRGIGKIYSSNYLIIRDIKNIWWYSSISYQKRSFKDALTNRKLAGRSMETILVWFWFWFYGISTIVGYLMPNPLYSYILILYMICKHILLKTFSNKPKLIPLHTVKWF